MQLVREQNVKQNRQQLYKIQLRDTEIRKRREKVHIRRIIVAGEEGERLKAAVIAEKLRPRREKGRVIIALHIKIKSADEHGCRREHKGAHEQSLIAKNSLPVKQQHGHAEDHGKRYEVKKLHFHSISYKKSGCQL